MRLWSHNDGLFPFAEVLVIRVSCLLNGCDRLRSLFGSGIRGAWGGVFLFLLLSCQSAPDRRVPLDWADRTLFATGTGVMRDGSFAERMRAVQYAKEEAARQMEEQILALPTDSGKTVSEYAEKEGNKKKIAAYVRRAEIIGVEHNARTVSLRVRLILGDSFKAALGLLPMKQQDPSPSNSGVSNGPP